jgi:hypothetical protein
VARDRRLSAIPETWAKKTASSLFGVGRNNRACRAMEVFWFG